MASTLNTITYGVAWFVAGWHIVAFVVGGAMIAWEHFTRPPEPTPEEISAEADAYEARYGEAATRQIGQDMYVERTANGSGKRYRFLRSVSGELIRRFVAAKEAHANVTMPLAGLGRAENSPNCPHNRC
jgi:hypothetical protein